MKELIEAGGSAYLIPAVLFALVLYAVRGVFGLHGRKSQHRKEFMELWSDTRSQDDLWLEVSIRHLFGTFLPADVIRLALSQPDKGQSLIDLSELWPLYQYDRNARTVSWLHRRHDTKKKRKTGRAFVLAGYFTAALVAVAAAYVAAKSGPGSLAGWAYGIFAVIAGAMALGCLMREDTLKTAASVGDYWLVRINTASPTRETPPKSSP